MITLLHSGTIRTMTGPDDVAEAIALDGDRIAAVGDLTHVRQEAQRLAAERGEQLREADLAGAAVVPGFIDPHGHLVQYGTMAALADLSEATSIPELQEILAAELRSRAEDPEADPAAPLVGVGYDHNRLAQRRHPTRQELDAVTEQVPVFVLHRSVHLGAASTSALVACGIDAGTADPPGARFGREADGATPSGYIEEMGALAQVARGLASPDAGPGLIPGARQTRREAIARAQRDYLAQGITTAQEGAATPADLEGLRESGAVGDLVLDMVVYPLVAAGGLEVLAAHGTELADYRDHVRLGGAKIILDGSPQGRSAWMSEPYEPEPSEPEPGSDAGDDPGSDVGACSCGYPAMPDDEVDGVVARLLGEGRQVLAHCNGDAAAEQFLRAYELAVARHGTPGDAAPPVMIHAQTVRDDQLDRMAALGMTASFFVGHVHYWGDVHLRNLGTKRGSRISPTRSALDRGVAITLHQDAPVTPPDMRVSLAAATGRTSREGTPIGPEQALTPFEALAAVTCGAAAQYGEHEDKGRLIPGMRADLVVCDRDPGHPDVTPAQLADLRILATVKDGQVVHAVPTAPVALDKEIP